MKIFFYVAFELFYAAFEIFYAAFDKLRQQQTPAATSSGSKRVVELAETTLIKMPKPHDQNYKTTYVRKSSMLPSTSSGSNKLRQQQAQAASENYINVFQPIKSIQQPFANLFSQFTEWFSVLRFNSPNFKLIFP